MRIDDWVELPSHVRYDVITFADSDRNGAEHGPRLVGKVDTDVSVILPVARPWYEFIVADTNNAHAILAALTQTLGDAADWNTDDPFVTAVIDHIDEYQAGYAWDIPFAQEYALALFADDRYHKRLEAADEKALAESICSLVETRTGNRRQHIGRDPIDVPPDEREHADTIVNAARPTVSFNREFRPDAERFLDLLHIVETEGRAYESTPTIRTV